MEKENTIMTNVYVVSDNITSPLGLTTTDNFAKLKEGQSAIKKHDNLAMSPQSFFASIFDENKKFDSPASFEYTKFEKLLITSIKDSVQHTDINLKDDKTVLIISSTKGNISLLENTDITPDLQKRIALPTSARFIADCFGYKSQPIIVSNACISGILALIAAKRLIQSGQFENAVVVGADVITKFILSGFQAFQAVSSEPCKPFDANRRGVTLGEGAATMILSSNKKYAHSAIKLTGGAVSNDANHISGPSRTGDGLALSIKNALTNAKLDAAAIDYISAHGTATLYNDEMEAGAFALNGLLNVPTNSLKGVYGHTLGAAGLIESVVAVQSLRENIILPSLGFEELGVSLPLNVSSQLQFKPLNNALKTGSGFGGCNAAVVFSK
jgi:3-oxoacyl-[acyl-carrier-protein] synthase I